MCRHHGHAHRTGIAHGFHVLCHEDPLGWDPRGTESEFAMRRNDDLSVLAPPVRTRGRPLDVIRGPCSPGRCVLYLEGALRAPLDGKLRHDVGVLLRLGGRIIVLDLTRVSRIDAAGIGELVRAYNMTLETNGVLQIVNPSPWVHQILERVGLLAILTAG